MKKIILILIIGFLSFPSIAQEGAFVGVRIIPQSAWILNNDDFDSGEFDFGIPFSVAFGISGGYMFNDILGAEVQVIYSPQGQKYLGDNKDPYATIKNNYLKIPVLFRFRSAGESASFLFNVGPAFGFLMNSTITDDETGMEIDPGIDVYESLDISINIGLGTSISLTDNLYLDLMINLGYGLTEIETTDGKAMLYDYQNNGRTSSNNALAGFSVGLNYVFGKPSASGPSIIK
jgi:hypothetical protein